MIVRKMQAVGLELFLAQAAIMAGIACMIPSRGLLYQVVQGSGFAIYVSLFFVATGICGCWAALRSRWRLRVTAAFCSAVIWFSIGLTYVIGEQYGLVMYLSVLFFVYNALISYERWGTQG